MEQHGTEHPPDRLLRRPEVERPPPYDPMKAPGEAHCTKNRAGEPCA